MRSGAEAYRAGDLSERTGRVIDAIAEYPDGCRAEDICDEVGMSKKDTATYMARTVGYGYVVRVGRGLYRPA